MKKLTALLTFVLAIGAAFITKAEPSKTVSGQKWFLYVGGPLNSPDSYVATTGDPGCSSDQELCAIFAEEDGNSMHPTQQSIDALGTINPSNPNVQYRDIE